MNFIDTERLYGYLRMCTGDEMSKRAKFTLVTWIGNDVSALKRAKISIDKALVKDVISVCCCFLLLFFNKMNFFNFSEFRH